MFHASFTSDVEISVSIEKLSLDIFVESALLFKTSQLLLKHVYVHLGKIRLEIVVQNIE